MHAYERVAESLAKDIDEGVWQPGAALPTIPELEKRFQVSRITVRAGIDELARRGLVFTGYVDGRRGTIVRSRGRVTHYATDALRSDRDRSTMDAFTESAAKVGKTASKRFEMRIEPAPLSITRRLGITNGDLVVVRTIYQLLDGEPWARETGYYPRDIAAELGLDVPHDIPEGTMRVISGSQHREIAHVDEVIYETADPQDAHDLAVPIGSPLLVQLRTAASTERITRVMRYVRIAERNRLVWEMGDEAGLKLINTALAEDSAA